MTRLPGNEEFNLDVVPKSRRKAAVSKRGQRSSADTLRELAAFHMMYGQTESAEHLLTVALWLNPEDGRSGRLMAHSLLRQGHAMEAARIMIDAAKLPDVSISFSDWKEVGLGLFRQGHAALGVKILGKVGKEKPRKRRERI